MRVEHLAIWTHDLERLKAFYTRYFGGKAGERYASPAHEKERVGQLTERLRADGYYESAVLDPDGNRLEITI